jgi:hypothetical protein
MTLIIEMKPKMEKIMVFVNQATYLALASRRMATGASMSVQIRLLVEAALGTGGTGGTGGARKTAKK